jgi:hypothetical protein
MLRKRVEKQMRKTKQRTVRKEGDELVGDKRDRKP